MYVLIVDDTGRFTHQISRKMRYDERFQHLTALVATTYEQAVAHLDSHGEEITIVATDVLLHNDPITRMPDPERCGPAVYWRTQQRAPKAIFVFLCNLGTVEDIVYKETGMNSMPPREEGGWHVIDTMSRNFFSGDWLQELIS